MRRYMLMALAVVLVIAARAPAAGAKKEAEKFDGTWEVVSVERDGEKVPQAEKGRAIIKGDKYTLKMGDEVVAEGTFKADRSKKPRTIDVMPTKGDNAGKTLQGVYELKDDELRICLGQPDKDRPAKLSSDDGYLLITYRRVKAEK